MAITIKDISNEYVMLTGRCTHRATRHQPAEYAEVERTAYEALHADTVYMITDGTWFTYTTNNYDRDEPKSAVEALIADGVTDEQRAEIIEWLEAEGFSSEKSMWESIVERAQDNLENED